MKPIVQSNNWNSKSMWDDAFPEKEQKTFVSMYDIHTFYYASTDAYAVAVFLRTRKQILLYS